MQIPRALSLDESIFIVICGYVLTVVASKILHASSRHHRPPSIVQATNSSFEGSAKDQRKPDRLACCSSPKGNQFLPIEPIQNQCNCADLVPIRKWQSRVEKTLTLNFQTVKRTLDDISKTILKRIQRLLLRTLVILYIALQWYCDTFIQATSIEELRDFLGEYSNESLCIKMDNTARSSDNLGDETTNTTSATSSPSSSTAYLPIDVDRSRSKFHNDELVAENSFAVAGVEPVDKYAEDIAEDIACDRKNDDTTWPGNDPSSHQFGSRSDIAGCSVDDDIETVDTKAKGNVDGLLIRSLIEIFFASILRDGDGDVFDVRAENIDETMTEEDKGDRAKIDEIPSPFPGDECCTEALADKFEEHLTLDAKSDKICPPTENDYPGKQAGMLPTEAVNTAEEGSLICPSEDPTRFQAEGEKETAGEFGPTPELQHPLKNCRQSESTGFLGLPSASGHGKEEEDLNALVRRMIIVELKKHRKKENVVLKRAHSDTETVIPRKRHTAKSRTGLFSLNDRTFFRDLLELEESLRKGNRNESSESVQVEVDAETVKREEPTKQDEVSTKNEGVDVLTNVVYANVSKSSAETTCKANSSIVLERKVNVPCLMNTEIEEERAAATENVTEPERQEQQPSKATQTERIHVIHTVKSCPLRIRHRWMHLQLYRLTTDREPYRSMTVFASCNFTRLVYRKASDDLIYEKGKGSRSPSYIPAAERFRWRYVLPNKVKRAN